MYEFEHGTEEIDSGIPDEPLVLVVGADDRFAMPLSVTLYSALVHLPDVARVRIHVFDGGISAKSRYRVERVVQETRPSAELKWHVLDMNHVEGLRVSRRVPAASYLRLLIAKVLLDERIVIYLDSDLLVRSDLSQLLVNAGRSPGSPVLAVRDFHHPSFGAVFGKAACTELGLDSREAYFNSGVLVIDLDRWREMGIDQTAFAFVRAHDSIMRYHDQDALNYALVNQWTELSPLWNTMLAQLHSHVERENEGETDLEPMMKEMVDGAFILHFIGGQKPWDARYTGLARGEYLHSLSNSGWFASMAELRRFRARYGLSKLLWTIYRLLPDGLRARVRSTAGQS